MAIPQSEGLARQICSFSRNDFALKGDLNRVVAATNKSTSLNRCCPPGPPVTPYPLAEVMAMENKALASPLCPKYFELGRIRAISLWPACIAWGHWASKAACSTRKAFKSIALLDMVSLAHGFADVSAHSYQFTGQGYRFRLEPADRRGP